MNNEQIIIDGVDASKCKYFSKYQKIVRNNEVVVDIQNACVEEIETKPCIRTHNCYFKNWQRKEQECEELKAKFQDMKKSRDIALKEYNEEFEYKRQITVEHLEQKKELLKQLDQLKTENEELKKQNNQFDNGINEQFSKIIELEGRNNFLKQILTEIKEIAENNKKSTLCFTAFEGDVIEVNNKPMTAILQKINEVEDVNN